VTLLQVTDVIYYFYGRFLVKTLLKNAIFRVLKC